jgi:hypothetical protein
VHIMPIHLFRHMECCFSANDEGVCETVNCKFLLHFNAACRVYTLFSYGEFATPLIGRRQGINLHVLWCYRGCAGKLL